MPDNPADSQSFFDQQNLGKANGETRQNSPPAEGFNPEDLSPSPVQRPKIQPTPPDPKPSHKPKTPPAIKIIQNNKYSEKVDPPLIDVKVTNPITYLKNWLERLLKNQDIDIRIKIKPFATLALIIAFSATFGIGYNVGLKKAANVFFPDSSPILHREVTHQGTIQKTDTGKYYLSLPDASLWALNPASSTVSVSLANSVNRQALVKGNLTAEKNVIDVKEVTPFDTDSNISPIPNPPSTDSSSNPEPADLNTTTQLPKLYSGFQWETDQKKTLLFTSGKRRIEQEGVYLESASLTEFPQEFINYYTKELTSSSFKQTLNSISAAGTTITYAKDDIFFTFGVENVYKGSGDSKTLSSYKAFLEHN